MAVSSNPKIQQLMDEVDSLDTSDPKMLDQLNEIALKIAAEQRQMKAVLTGRPVSDDNLVDPADAFACEGCQ